jgi:ABC-type Fe3+/spermidine/putrescine transport system ATPase subunit
MRVELRNLQRQLGLMFIHVTHNQEESLSMADRIVVMHEARIQQVGDPLTISTKPENEIVAAFMGDNNIVRGTVISRENGRIVVDAGYVKVSCDAKGSELQVGASAAIAVRAAALEVHDQGTAPSGDTNHLSPEILFVEYLGDLVKLHLTVGGERMIAKITGDRFPAFRGKEGTTVPVSWKEQDVQLLGA